MKRARFIAAARLEFLAEVVYYNDAQQGLGERFAAAVEEAAARAVAFPLAGSPSRARTRRMIVKGFPFSLFYRPESDEIVAFSGRTPCTAPLLLAVALTRPLTQVETDGPPASRHR